MAEKEAKSGKAKLEKLKAAAAAKKKGSTTAQTPTPRTTPKIPEAPAPPPKKPPEAPAKKAPEVTPPKAPEAPKRVQKEPEAPAPKKSQKEPEAKRTAPSKDEEGLETATFACGSFYDSEDLFFVIAGVRGTEVGFSGGTVPNPKYDDVINDKTGHAEAIRVKYDPKIITYEQLLEVFFITSDPIQLTMKSPIMGSAFRYVIFYHNPEQKKLAEDAIKRWQPQYKRPITVQIVPASKFYKAEEYHQRYNRKHGYRFSIHNAEKIRKYLRL